MEKMSLPRKAVAFLCSAALACALVPAMALSAFGEASTINSFTTTGTNSALGATYTHTVGGSSKTTVASVTETTDDPLYYIMQGKSTQVFKVTTYIEADDLLGDGWTDGATFNFNDRTKGDAIPYEYDSEGKFYPDYTYHATATSEDFSTKDAEDVPMVLALDAQTITLTDGQIVSEAIEKADTDNAWTSDSKATRWMSGTPESMYTAQSLMAGNVFWTYDANADVTAALTYSQSEALNSVTVNATDGRTGAKTTTSFTAAQLKSKVQTATAGKELYYIMNGNTVFKATSYIKVSDLFGNSWTTGSVFNLSDRSKGTKIPYEYDSEGKFYPNYVYHSAKSTVEDFDTKGAVSVPMVFILDAVSVSMQDGETASDAISRADTGNAWQVKNIRLAAGTPESMYSTQSTMAGNVFWTYTDGADVIANVEYTSVAPAPAAKKAVKTFTVNTKTVTAKAVKAAAKKAGATTKTATSITLGKKVKTIKAGAFKSFTKVKTLTVKTKKLTKKSVKKALKGSKVKTIKVKIGSKKTNKKYVKAYKKIFTKKIAGKKAAVK